MAKKGDRAAVGRKSKAKGGRFEREAWKHFAAWTDNKPGFKKNRTDGNQWEGMVRGDIIPDWRSPDDAEKWPCILSIECKDVEGWLLSKLLLGQAADIRGFWTQTVKQAAGTSFYPFLVFKRNHHKPLCIYPEQLADHNGVTIRGDTFIWTPDTEPLVIESLDGFFSQFTYSKMIRTWKGGTRYEPNSRGTSRRRK